MLFIIVYPQGVTCLKWLPVEIDPTGVQVLIGYADGVLRLFAIESEGDSITGGGGNIYKVTKSLSAR